MGKPFLTALFILLSFSLSAQENISVSRKEFRTDQPGFDAAWRHIKDGDSFYSKGGILYARALEEYRLAYPYNKVNAALNYKMGVAALFTDKKEEAAEYFSRAYGINNEISDDILLLYGRALIYSGNYREAEEKLKAYLELPGKKTSSIISFVNRLLDECRRLPELTKDTIRVEIKNLGGDINSGSDDYSPVLSSDGKKMFFASRRSLKDREKSPYRDSKYNENIFTSENSNGKWSVAVPASKNLNTVYCETPLYIDRSGSLLYIYEGFEGNGDIMVSEFKKGDWKPVKPENFGINSKNSESSFCISPAGNEIAFVSDRGKRGKSGKDIYFIHRKGKKWSKPENAGDSINSKSDEESVCYSRNGDTLWFSSRGHNTLGGFDIFYSVRNSLGTWGKAVNAGYPLNTQWNDMFYIPSPVSDSVFYFASDRSGGMGGFDIYTGRFLPKPHAVETRKLPLQGTNPVVLPKKDTVQVIVPKHDTIVVRDTVVVVKEVAAQPVVAVKEKEIFLAGKVTDADNRSPVISRIDIIDQAGGSVVGTTASSDVDGSYRVKLPGKKTYTVDIRATGYLSDVRKVSIPDSFIDESFVLNISLSKVKVGKKVVMKNIFFESGKSVLTKSSFEELDKLVKILEDNQGMKIEISGHTDNTGSAVVNARLSTERARAVVDYIAGKGIDRSRLTYMGYGSDQPVADNSSEAGRAKNRRVEFKILEF